MRRRKREFAANERYAIWMCHDKRCWRCGEPLRLFRTSIDHFFPERLLKDDVARAQCLSDFELQPSFNINDFENWLPCCRQCNDEKGGRVPEVWQKNKDTLTLLLQRKNWVRQTAGSVRQNVAKDKVLTAIFIALEQKTISLVDLDQMLIEILERPRDSGMSDDVIVLDDGYLRKRATIVKEQFCGCERQVCVGEERKIFCYFHDGLPNWVIKKGLFQRCYEEQTICVRCGENHLRGHVGRLNYCGKPFADQERQFD